MKAKFLRGLSALASAAGALAAFSAGGIATFVPAQYSTILIGVALGALAVKDGALCIGDRLDDGQLNGSFKSLFLLFCLGIALACSSCVSSTTTAADGSSVKTTSFLTPDDLAAAANLAKEFKSKATVEPVK